MGLLESASIHGHIQNRSNLTQTNKTMQVSVLGQSSTIQSIGRLKKSLLSVFRRNSAWGLE